MKIFGKWAIVGCLFISVNLQAQLKNQTTLDVLPMLKTNTSMESMEGLLLSAGFVNKGPNGVKQKSFNGLLDSVPVLLTVRKTSRKGVVCGYNLMYENTDNNWIKKRLFIDQLAVSINKSNKQNPSVLLKTLPQYCHGNEVQCFADGFAKYQYSWYWNNGVSRIKSMELKVTPSFQITLTITDNALEAASGNNN